MRAAFDQEAANTGQERLLFTMAVGCGKEVVDRGYEIDKIHK